MVKQRQGYCQRCRRYTLHVAEGYQVPHIFHLILSLLTGGLWLFVWLFHVAANMASPGQEFLCSQCGQREGELTAQQQAVADARTEAEHLQLERLKAATRARRYESRIKRRTQRRKFRLERKRRFWERVDRRLAAIFGEESDLVIGFFGGLLRMLAYLLPFAAIAAAVIGLVCYAIHRGWLPSP